MLFPRLPLLALFMAPLAAAPISEVVPNLNQIHKWDDSHGDTWDPFWADDGRLYAFNCDGRGFGEPGTQRNLAFNVLSGDAPDGLVGHRVNPMEDYGKSGQKGPDGATWKICGQECIDGVFYGFVCRNIYGRESGDPLMRQTSFNASLIKSGDHGRTWTRSAAENDASPMWPGGRFGSPGFFHFGQNGGNVARDGADEYVYAISNNGFWNGGDDFVLGRVKRSSLARLEAHDWKYFTGADGNDPKSWSFELSRAQPILSAPGKLGWTSPVFVPALERYLLVSWYVTPTLKKWFQPQSVRYEFFQAEHPWGPWTKINGFDDSFLGGDHMYGPNVCARFQEPVADGVRVMLFTSGCPFKDVPDSPYKLWSFPLLLRTGPMRVTKTVSLQDPAVVRQGNRTELAFEGTGVEVLSERSAESGELEIGVDGLPFERVDTRMTDFRRLKLIAVFTKVGLAPGKHRLLVVSHSTLEPGPLEGFRIFSEP